MKVNVRIADDTDNSVETAAVDGAVPSPDVPADKPVAAKPRKAKRQKPASKPKPKAVAVAADADAAKESQAAEPQATNAPTPSETVPVTVSTPAPAAPTPTPLVRPVARPMAPIVKRPQPASAPATPPSRPAPPSPPSSPLANSASLAANISPASTTRNAYGSISSPAKPPRRSLADAWHHTRKRRVAGVLLLLFALVNAGLYAMYSNRTYPGTTINSRPVGSVTGGELASRINGLQLLPEQLTLHYKQTHNRVTPAEVGMRIDSEQTAKALLDNRSWLPVVNLFQAPRGTAVIGVEPKTYQATVQELGRPLQTKAVDAKLELRAGDFRIVPETNAQAVDLSGTQAAIVEALSNGRTDAQLTLRSVPPAVTSFSLQPQLQTLQAQRNAAITLASNGKTKRFSANQIGNWFSGSGNEAKNYQLVKPKVSMAIEDASLELSVAVADADPIADRVMQAVTAAKATSIDITGRKLGDRTYNFCTNVRGVPESELASLNAKAASTLNDQRGWSLGGRIKFTQAATDCQFTIWLTAAEQMPSFGAICDPMWSCAVTPNVVINYDRWQKASEPWNKTGGNIDEYRAMAINHEVGHWLGFDHSSCPAPGQAAPLMQQQSINLQGCVFNAWPTTTERVTLRDYLKL